MTNARNKKLLEDRYQSHPLLAELKATLELSESFATKASAVKTDAHLSVAGRNSKTEKLVRSTLRDLRDLTQGVDAKRARLADVLANIKPVSFDPTNVASALLRGEMRAAIKSMTLSERAAILMGDQAEVAFVDSVLEASPILSGLDSSLYEGVREQRLQSLFGAESLEAESLSTEIEEAQAILTLAKQDVAAASGLREHEFAALERDVYSRKDSPWLRKERNMNGEDVTVVVPVNGGPARPATEAEIKDGQYFANLSEYRASRAA
jgi:hypothetical protein